ncbi:hypothetical protein CBL_08609 [Carabus blaptoides fortunei]
MRFNDFYEWKDSTSLYKVNKSKPRPYLSDMVNVKAERGKHHIMYRCDFGEEMRNLDFLNKKAVIFMEKPKSREQCCGISEEKKNDILPKLAGVMSANRRVFWETIPAKEKPVLTEKQKKARLTWAKSKLSWSVEAWSRDTKAERALLPVSRCHASELLPKKILPDLRNDNISEIIRNDRLILLFGSDLALKLCHEQHLSSHVRERMRELARLVEYIKDLDHTFHQLEDLYHPRNTDLFFKALTNLTQLDVSSGT